MKQLAGIAIAIVFLATGYAVAQNTVTAVPLTGSGVAVLAGSVEIRGNGTTCSKGVVVTVNGVRVTADRAVVRVQDFGGNEAQEIELEGNVRLSVPKRP